MDSAIFSDGDVYDIWNEVVRVTAPWDGKQATYSREAIYKAEAMRAPYDWQRALMQWAMFVALWSRDHTLTSGGNCCDWDQCGKKTWQEFLKIAKPKFDDVLCNGWNPNI